MGTRPGVDFKRKQLKVVVASIQNACQRFRVFAACKGKLLALPGPPVRPRTSNVLQIGCGDKKNRLSPLNLPNLSEVSTCIRLMIRRQLREPFSVKAIATQETPTETTRFFTGHHRKRSSQPHNPWLLISPCALQIQLMAYDAFSFPVLVAWEGLQPPSVVDMWLEHVTWFTSRKSGGKTRFKNSTKKIHPYNICMYVSITYVQKPQPRYTFLEASPRRCGFGTFSILLRSGPTPTCSVQQACFFSSRSLFFPVANSHMEQPLEGDNFCLRSKVHNDGDLLPSRPYSL